MRGGDWFNSTTQVVDGFDSQSSSMNYGASSDNGDCAKAVEHQGIFLGLHNGTWNDKRRNRFTIMSAVIEQRLKHK
jgi:hypothetical protein